MDSYDYDVTHAWLSQVMPFDVVLMGGVAPNVISFHYGCPDAAQTMLHQCMEILRRVLDDPVEERTMKWFEIMVAPVLWGWSVSLLTGDPADAAAVVAMMSKAELTWTEASSTVNAYKHLVVHLHQGQKPSWDAGGGFMTAELVILYLKLMWVLLAAEPGVTAVEVMASLPEYDEVHMISMAYNATSTVGATGWLPSAAYLLALVCEKFGRFEEAAPWAEAASSNDCGRLGTKNVFIHAQARRAHGRCLSKLGKAIEAVQAFESAAQIGASSGLYLEELLALAELQSFTGQESMHRIKSAMHKMLGPTPTEAQMKSITKANLPAGVTWNMIMA